MPRTYAVVGSLPTPGFKDAVRGGVEYLFSNLSQRPISILHNHQFGQFDCPEGFAQVYNRLVEAAFADPKCEYVWIMNDDVWGVSAIPRGFDLKLNPDAMIDYMDAHEDVGVLFPVEFWEEDRELTTIIPFDGAKVQNEEAIAALSDEPIEQLFAGFAFACVRRAAWFAVGPMDESLGIGYAEDLDWGIRCWRAGYRVVNYRACGFMHERGGTYGQLVEYGVITQQTPRSAAEKCKEKWPFLWSDKTGEEILAMLRKWREEAWFA